MHATRFLSSGRLAGSWAFCDCDSMQVMNGRVHRWRCMRLRLLLAALFCASGGAAQNECLSNVRSYGARGDGVALDTRAIQSAFDACAGAGIPVVFPPGVYRSGTLRLRSGLTIGLQESAVLLGSPDHRDYLEPDKSEQPALGYDGVPHFVLGTASRHVFLYGDGVRNVQIRGPGTIDGNRTPGGHAQRGPLSVFFQHSRDITLEGIKVTNSPGWSVTFFHCERVRILGVKLENVMADGINPVSCRDVIYDGVEIDGSGDDPICIKNEGPRPPGGYVTRDIIVRNTRVRNTTHPGFKIGTGTYGTFENILVEDSTFDSPGDFFTIQLMRPTPPEETQRYIRNVKVRRVQVTRARRLLDITVIGVDRPVIENLEFEDIRFRGTAVASRIQGTRFSPVGPVRIAGLQFDRNEGKAPWIRLDHVRAFALAKAVLNVPGASCLVEANDSADLAFQGLTATGFGAGATVYRLTDVRGAQLTAAGVSATIQTAEVRGPKTARVSFDRGPAAIAGDVAPEGIAAAVPVKITSIKGPAAVRAGEPVTLTLGAIATEAGPARISVVADGREAGAAWAWMEAGKRAAVPLQLTPVYRPGKYLLGAGGRARHLSVLPTPARLAPADWYTIETGPRALAVRLAVRNTGGTTGTTTVYLTPDGQAPRPATLRIAPGETAEAVFPLPAARPFQLDGFAPWRHQVFANVPARYKVSGETIEIEAGGRIGETNDYAAVYQPAVAEDFDLIAQVVEHTGDLGEYAAAGLIVRSRIAEPTSPGLVLHFRTEKYGGFKILASDTDGDGKIDKRSYTGSPMLPVWYKIERRGRRVEAFWSADGSSWTTCGAVENALLDGPLDAGIYGAAWNVQGSRIRASFSRFGVIRR